jgi:hypothetical protein
MSMSKAQAKILMDPVLNGSAGLDSLNPVETLTELELLAGKFVEECQKNLIKSNSISSGDLSASIAAQDPEHSGTIVKVNIEMLLYGQFVNAGVKGTQKGRSTAGYEFKKLFPSKAFVESIEKWQERGRAATKNVAKAYKKLEKKNTSISQISSAYAIARSIMQKGLKPTGFLDKASKTIDDEVEQRLGAAFEIDIINSLRK